MARHNSPIIAQLRAARTLPDQILALRALKNEIVGHVQLKEAWIGFGVLEPIVKTISSSVPARPHGKAARSPSGSQLRADEDAAKLQALQLVASFANGSYRLLLLCSHGPPYSTPISHPSWPYC